MLDDAEKYLKILTSYEHAAHEREEPLPSHDLERFRKPLLKVKRAIDSGKLDPVTTLVIKSRYKRLMDHLKQFQILLHRKGMLLRKMQDRAKRLQTAETDPTDVAELEQIDLALNQLSEQSAQEESRPEVNQTQKILNDVITQTLAQSEKHFAIIKKDDK